MAIKYDNCKDCHSRCVHAGKDREFICINGVSCKITKQKPNTNADRIRAMSDEELGKYLCWLAGCHDCEGRSLCEHPDFKSGDGYTKWLKQPAEVD